MKVGKKQVSWLALGGPAPSLAKPVFAGSQPGFSDTFLDVPGVTSNPHSCPQCGVNIDPPPWGQFALISSSSLINRLPQAQECHHPSILNPYFSRPSHS